MDRLGKGCALQPASAEYSHKHVRFTNGTVLSMNSCIIEKQIVEYLGLRESEVDGVFAGVCVCHRVLVKW